MKIHEVRELIKLIDQSTIDEFEYEQDGAKVVLKKRENGNAQPVSASTFEEQALFTGPTEVTKKAGKTEPAEQQQDENVHKIESPMVGTFYTSSSPETDSYVGVGDKVKADTVVCIVEAMKLFNEIEADQEGEIVEILAEDGQLVEYGQPLFLMRTDV